eukprot:gene43220-62016_t
MPGIAGTADILDDFDKEMLGIGAAMARASSCKMEQRRMEATTPRQ